MSKNFDSKLSRMEYLMGYRMPVNEQKSNVEYFTEGADGKIYGILKEGNMYYIKTSEKGKETLAESYEYIGGFNYRNENGYKSYNAATKQLEQKMITLNESYGVHKDVSTVDFNRGEKLLEGLTQEARKELDRVKLIMENSMGIKDNIGNHGNPEGKGTSTGAQTEKNNDPFSDKKDEKLTKDSVEEEADPKKANSDYTDASKSVESQMTSDKAPKKATDSGDPNKDYELTHDDLDGDGVADKNPKGAKAVMVNEDVDDYDEFNLDDYTDDLIDTPIENADQDEPYEEGSEDLVGFGDDETEDYDLDALMEEFEERIAGDDETLTGPHGGSEVQTADWLNKPEGAEEKQEALDGPKGSCKKLTTDRLSESQMRMVNRVTNKVVERLFESKKNRKRRNMNEGEDKLVRKVMRLVKEEMQEWGKHPKFGQPAFTTPPSTEVLAGTAEKDWNDDSAKGSERYGKKIGKSSPFDEKVNVLTDSVMAVLKEQLGLKKKVNTKNIALREGMYTWDTSMDDYDKQDQERNMYANYGNKSQYTGDEYYDYPNENGELSMDAQLGGDPNELDDFDPEMTPVRGNDPEYWASKIGEMNEGKSRRLKKK